MAKNLTNIPHNIKQRMEAGGRFATGPAGLSTGSDGRTRWGWQSCGATGYLQKYSGEEELLAAVRDVADGRLRIPTATVRRVFAAIRGEAGLTS